MLEEFPDRITDHATEYWKEQSVSLAVD